MDVNEAKSAMREWILEGDGEMRSAMMALDEGRREDALAGLEASEDCLNRALGLIRRARVDLCGGDAAAVSAGCGAFGVISAGFSAAAKGADAVVALAREGDLSGACRRIVNAQYELARHTQLSDMVGLRPVDAPRREAWEKLAIAGDSIRAAIEHNKAGDMRRSAGLIDAACERCEEAAALARRCEALATVDSAVESCALGVLAAA